MKFVLAAVRPSDDAEDQRISVMVATPSGDSELFRVNADYVSFDHLWAEEFVGRRFPGVKHKIHGAVPVKNTPGGIYVAEVYVESTVVV